MTHRTVWLLVLAMTVIGGERCLAQSPPETGFLSRVFHDDLGDHRYVLYVPTDYSPEKKWPVVLYLHGAGGRGHDGRRHLAEGLAPIIRLKENFPALVVFPQCEDTEGPILEAWLADSPDGERAIQILHQVETEFSVSSDRRILVGWSMGGYGVWSQAAAHPELWSAVVPVSGGGSPDLAPRLTTVPIWAIHGGRDRAILPEQSERLVDAIRRIGGNATYTEIAGIGHDVWKYALDSAALLEWMLAPSSGSPPADRLQAEIAHLVETGELDALQGPFHAALIVPRAVSIRIGGDALRTIAYGIPDAVRNERLDGRLDNLHYTFHFEDDTFDIRLSDLTYDARLQRVTIATMADGRVRLLIGVQPLTLRIGATTIEGPRHHAAAGPIVVRIGHLRPVWFDLTLRPAVEDHKLHLNLMRADFRIPDENWFVQPPEQVTAEGPGITTDLVRTGIVGGLYVRRTDIEQQVRSVIPALVNKVEERIAPVDGGRLARGIWPLPVFRPRLQFQLDDLAIDEGGISLSLDVAAAALNTLQPAGRPKISLPIGPAAADVPRSRQLEIAIAPGLLEPLSRLLVDADAARIDVRDIPEPEFAPLADPAVLAEILPDLRRFGPELEVRSEIVLTGPFRIEPDGATPESPAQSEASLSARLHVPSLAVMVSVRRTAESVWAPYAELVIDTNQRASVELQRPDWSHRALQFGWAGDAEIQVSGHFLDAAHVVDPSIDTSRVESIIRTGWSAWTEDAAQAPVAIHDVSVGSARLRMEEIGWRDAQIAAGFVTPGTRITNVGPEAFHFEVRGPFSPWSDVERLPAGESRTYNVPYPITFRRRDERLEPPLTLPLGSLTEFEHGVLKSTD